MRCIGNVTGTFDHHLYVMFPSAFCQLSERAQFGELRFVIGVINRAGAKTIAQTERNVISLHDFADLIEIRVEEILLMVGKTPLGHNRTAARHDSRQSLRRERNPRQSNTGVQREIVDTLLSLLDERVAHQFPGEFFRASAHFFKSLIDGNGANRHRRVAKNPLPDFVNVFSG